MRIILNIKRIRHEKCLTLKDLSKLTGISTSHINDIENHYKMPSLLIVILISKALHVDIKELFEVKW